MKGITIPELLRFQWRYYNVIANSQCTEVPYWFCVVLAVHGLVLNKQIFLGFAFPRYMVWVNTFKSNEIGKKMKYTAKQK